MNNRDKFRELSNPLGVHPINWSNDDFKDLGADTSVEKCFQQMHEAGFVGTEVGNKYPKEPHKLRALMKPYRLRLIGGWHSTLLAYNAYPDEETRLLEYLDFLKAMDASVVVLAECSNAIHGDESKSLVFEDEAIGLSEDQWQRVFQGLDKLSELAANSGIPAVYHHHMGTVVQSEESLDALMANTKTLKLLFDTGHLTFAGIDPAQVLEKYIDRISHVHLKNVRPSIVQRARSDSLSFGQAVRAGVFTVPGDASEGESGVDYPPLLSRLAESGYKGWYVVEAEQDPEIADPLEYARAARNYLNEITGL